jgi:hypothetical protein
MMEGLEGFSKMPHKVLTFFFYPYNFLQKILNPPNPPTLHYQNFKFSDGSFIIQQEKNEKS